jgi:hypothetical protein
MGWVFKQRAYEVFCLFHLGAYIFSKKNLGAYIERGLHMVVQSSPGLPFFGLNSTCELVRSFFLLKPRKCASMRRELCPSIMSHVQTLLAAGYIYR